MLHFTQYRHESDDKDWVTFIHGAGGSSAIWYKQVRDFRQHYHVLLIDLRGHGRSKHLPVLPASAYTFDRIGNDIIEVLDHLAVKATHFVGISLGTIIIREITERFPHRALSMIMGGAVMQINLRGQILMRVGSIFKSVIPYMYLYRFFALIIMPRRKHREARNLFVREARKLYQKEFRKWFSLVSEVNSLLKWFRMRDPEVPALYVMGSEDYMFLPSISRLVEGQKKATLQIIPACGHVVNVEQPQAFNDLTLNWLQQQNDHLSGLIGD